MYQQPIQPTYRRFVYSFALWGATGMALFIYAWVALVTILIGGFVPGIDELNAVGTHYLAVAGFGVTLFNLIFYQNDRWLEQYRNESEPQPQTAPRPLTSRNVQDTQRLTAQMALGRNEFFPVFSHHYAELYRRLQRNRWKITKRVLNFEVDTVKVFPNLGEKYMGIVKEWNRLGYVDGYVRGEAREKWFLNAAGQAKFAELGRVHEAPHSPTDII